MCSIIVWQRLLRSLFAALQSNSEKKSMTSKGIEVIWNGKREENGNKNLKEKKTFQMKYWEIFLYEDFDLQTGK